MKRYLLNQPLMKLNHAPFLLMGIMTVSIIVIVGLTIWLLYEAGYEQQRQRLIEMVQTQSGMIKTLAKHEYSDEQKRVKDEDERLRRTAEETLKRVMLSHPRDMGLGKTGEFTLAKLDDNHIHFLLSHRHKEVSRMDSISMDAKSAEPMRRALRGKSGTVVGLDYRDVTVLAAFKPVPTLGWGIVAKIDLDEIREPYIMAGVYAGAGALFLIVIGSSLFFTVLRPILEHLESSNRYNRMLFNHSPIGLALCRMDGSLVDINRSYAAIIGRSVEETLPLSYWEITPKKYEPMEELQLASLRQNGKYGPYEKEYIHKKGHLIPVRLSGRLLDVGGERYIWSSVEDISERKQNEEQLRQASLVFDNASEAILIADEKRRIVRVNRAFSKITGYSYTEVLGKDPNFMQSGRHDDAFYDAMWHSINTKGEWRGEIWNCRKDGKQFPVLQSITAVFNDEGEVTSYVSVFSDISRQKAYEKELAHLANHDPLTGLPNRMLFENSLEQTLQRAARNKSRFALLFLDLDHFKETNDTYGHDIGDRLLQTVAARLKERLRGEDVVARLGGDEFTVILSEITGADDAAHVTQELLEMIETPFDAENQTIRPEGSIGIAIYPDHGTEMRTLIKAADAAMYAAKEKSWKRYAIYGKEV